VHIETFPTFQVSLLVPKLSIEMKNVSNKAYNGQHLSSIVHADEKEDNDVIWSKHADGILLQVQCNK